jgi:hypothetical protein
MIIPKESELRYLGCYEKRLFIPNSGVGEHARHGRGGTRLASRTWHDVIPSASLELFRTTHGFPRGAENSARDGRAPFSISEFGFKTA